jgi:hypothetical protein
VCGHPPLNPGVEKRRGLVQAFVPFAVWIGIGGDATADAHDRIACAIELDGPDRHVELASRRG